MEHPKWTYRVIRRTWPSGAEQVGVHEVYHRPDGGIKSWTEDPILPVGASLETFMEDLGRFTAATSLPVLTVVSGSLVEWNPSEGP